MRSPTSCPHRIAARVASALRRLSRRDRGERVAGRTGKIAVDAQEGSPHGHPAVERSQGVRDCRRLVASRRLQPDSRSTEHEAGILDVPVASSGPAVPRKERCRAPRRGDPPVPSRGPETRSGRLPEPSSSGVSARLHFRARAPEGAAPSRSFPSHASSIHGGDRLLPRAPISSFAIAGQPASLAPRYGAYLELAPARPAPGEPVLLNRSALRLPREPARAETATDRGSSLTPPSVPPPQLGPGVGMPIEDVG